MIADVAQQIEEEGYLIVENVLGTDELEACREEVHRLHELYLELDQAGDPRAKKFQIEPFADEQVKDGLPVLRKIEETDAFSNVFTKLAAHPKLVAVLTEILGPDLLLFRSTLMLKPAFHGSVHGLHQDSSYWPIDPPTSVTLSVALTDATPENGCFRVLPGSHKSGLREWGRIAQDQSTNPEDEKDVDPKGMIEVPLAAGSALFFHSMVVHGSGPNRSPIPRNTALYAYFPPNVNYRPGPKRPQQREFRVIHGCDGRETVTLVGENV